jgi:AraC-like DNA-binding protein
MLFLKQRQAGSPGRRALTSTTRSVAEIAFEVGYESESSFNRAF